MLLSRPSGDFNSFQSAAVPSVPPMQVTPLAPETAPASTASVAAASNVDLLGDLDLSHPSMPIQINSFSSPPVAAQSSTYPMTAMTVPLSGGVTGAEAAVNFNPVMPYVTAGTAGSSVPGTASTATSVESVCMSVRASSLYYTLFLNNISNLLHRVYTGF